MKRTRWRTISRDFPTSSIKQARQTRNGNHGIQNYLQQTFPGIEDFAAVPHTTAFNHDFDSALQDCTASQENWCQPQFIDRWVN
jgi:hypothetical protein